MNKKAGVSIAVVFLVLATLILVVSALFYFNIKKQDYTRKIYSGTYLEEIYSEEEWIISYIREIVAEVSEQADSGENFVELFNKRLSERPYEKQGVEIKLGDVRFEDGNFIVNTEIGINQGFGQDENSILIEYKILKTFINKKTY